MFRNISSFLYFYLDEIFRKGCSVFTNVNNKSVCVCVCVCVCVFERVSE